MDLSSRTRRRLHRHRLSGMVLNQGVKKTYLYRMCFKPVAIAHPYLENTPEKHFLDGVLGTIAPRIQVASLPPNCCSEFSVIEKGSEGRVAVLAVSTVNSAGF